MLCRMNETRTMAFFGFADIGGLRLVDTIASLLLVDLLEWQGVYFRSSANHSTRQGLGGSSNIKWRAAHQMENGS